MKKEIWYNLVAITVGIIVFFVVVLFLSGCEETGRTGPTRFAAGIHGGSNGTDTAWFTYVDVYNNPIIQEGIRMDFEAGHTGYRKFEGVNGYVWYKAPGGIQTVVSDGITGPCGFVLGHGKRDWSQEWTYALQTIGRFSNPRITTQRASMTYRSRCSDGAQHAFHEAYQTINRTVASTGDRRWNLTEHEYNLLSSDTENAPDSGMTVSRTRLVSQSGSKGGGFSREIDSPLATNLICEDQYLRYASPFAYSFVIKTAEPLDIIDREVSGRVVSDSFPEGIEVKAFVYDSSDDLQTHVVRTEHFLIVDNAFDQAYEPQLIYDRWTPPDGDPNDVWDEDIYAAMVKDDWFDYVDPNSYDPNDISDPNDLFDPDNPDFYDFVHRLDTRHPRFDEAKLPDRIIEVQSLPVMAEGDYIEFQLDRRSLLVFLDYWMTDKRNYDLNGDGIVNLKDWVLMF